MPNSLELNVSPALLHTFAKGLLFSQFRRGFRCAYNIKMLFTVAILDDALCHDYIVQLIM